MNLPPPCVSKSSPEWIKYRTRLWYDNNREYLNKYCNDYYHSNLLRERERHRLYYHKSKSKKTYTKLTPEQVTDKMEADRKYREEMAVKGFIL
jgi:hypothetical protein